MSNSKEMIIYCIIKMKIQQQQKIYGKYLFGLLHLKNHQNIIYNQIFKNFFHSNTTGFRYKLI